MFGWCFGILVLWFYGRKPTNFEWYFGVVVLWCYGLKPTDLEWYFGVMVLWCFGLKPNFLFVDGFLISTQESSLLGDLGV
jgi:hypothetical protein